MCALIDPLAIDLIRLGKMHNAIPRLLELMEQVPEIKDIRPYTEPITQTINFNTRAEKICLQTLQPVVRPEIDHRRSMLEPGMLYRTCHILGIDVKLDKDGGLFKRSFILGNDPDIHLHCRTNSRGCKQTSINV